MPDSFDVIVVGAGLAGSACALALARNGVRVCVCERGAWPGEKSLSGMILYGRPLADLIPAFWKDAPVERAITRRRFSGLSQDSEVALDLRHEAVGLRGPYPPRKVAVGVKEVLALPCEILQERFGLEDNEGVAMEFFGQSVKGLVGSAFLYTNQDTLSVGLSCSVESLIAGGIPPAELLAQFKQHPSARRWLRGGERVEYGAQMIPEGGYYGVPLL